MATYSKKKIKFKLFMKFIIVTSLVLFIVLFTGGGFLMKFQSDVLIEEKFKSNKMFTDLIARISSGPSTRLDYSALEEIAFKLQLGRFDNYEILSVIFTDKDGNKLNLNGVAHKNIEVPKKYWNTEESLLLTKDRRYVGKVTILFSLKRVMEKIQYVRMIFSIAIFLTILTLDLIISALILIFITRPLKKLTSDVQVLSKGNFDIKASYPFNDEIGFLETSFISMSRELEQSFLQLGQAKKELKEYSITLEDKVTERTKEIKDMNDELNDIHEKIKQELKTAQTIQLNIIPKDEDFPQKKELRFGYKYSSMDSVGGDLYDVIDIGNDRFGLLIADVSGHGVPAALVTSMAKVSFTSNSKDANTTAEVCYNVNNELCKLIGNLPFYLTAYFGVLNIDTGMFEYSNAAHHPALLIRYDSGQIESLDADGFSMGSFEDIDYEYKTIRLSKGDRLLLFTDGITEAQNSDNKLYGYDNLYKYINKNLQLPPKDFVNNLMKDIEIFCKGNPPADDKAVLMIELSEGRHKANYASAGMGFKNI